MAKGWEYSESARRYRSSETGRFLSATKTRELRDDFVARQRAWSEDLARMVSTGQLSVQAWEVEMRDRVKVVHSTQFLYGRGGRNAITAADRTTMGKLVRSQFTYLHSFARDIASGEMTEGQIRARGQRYFDSATTSYERGRSAAFGMPELPAYPGDGTTACLSGCKCAWSLEETDDGWTCTWQLDSDAESCADCLERAERYNPLVLSKGG